jgi:hypothetical protein
VCGRPLLHPPRLLPPRCERPVSTTEPRGLPTPPTTRPSETVTTTSTSTSTSGSTSTSTSGCRQGFWCGTHHAKARALLVACLHAVAPRAGWRHGAPLSVLAAYRQRQQQRPCQRHSRRQRQHQRQHQRQRQRQHQHERVPAGALVGPTPRQDSRAAGGLPARGSTAGRLEARRAPVGAGCLPSAAAAASLSASPSETEAAPEAAPAAAAAPARAGAGRGFGGAHTTPRLARRWWPARTR